MDKPLIVTEHLSSLNTRYRHEEQEMYGCFCIYTPLPSEAEVEAVLGSSLVFVFQDKNFSMNPFVFFFPDIGILALVNSESISFSQ